MVNMDKSVLTSVALAAEASGTIEKLAPRRGRRPVLAAPTLDIVRDLVSDPGEWYLIAWGPKFRHGSIAQTAHRIRRGLFSRLVAGGGEFEVRVSTDPTLADRIAEVELYCRWVPAE